MEAELFAIHIFRESHLFAKVTGVGSDPGLAPTSYSSLLHVGLLLVGVSVLPSSHSHLSHKDITQRVYISYRLIDALAQASY